MPDQVQKMRHFAPQCYWSVIRQDDNGNRYVLSANHSREEAMKKVREFESRHHKQTYWIKQESLT